MGCDWQLMYKLYVMLLALPQGYSHVNYSTPEAPAAALDSMSARVISVC